MKNIVYYMPRLMADTFQEEPKDFLKLVSKNASAIDRTGNFKLPFETQTIWKIPEQIDEGDTCSMFNYAMLDRARSMLATNLPITIFYSGGLDSTGILVAFDHIIKTENFNREQITIATSVNAMYENFDCWWSLVLNYKLINVHDCLNSLDFDTTLYIMGENADQLFGSDKIFQLPRISNVLLTGTFNETNLNIYLDELEINKSEQFLDSLFGLISSSPFKVEKMSELLWWVNFSCKWQSVSLRTLCFTKILNSNKEISGKQLKTFETFYNTDRFQQISMLKSFKRFGDTPSAESYKFALRNFIQHIHPDWSYYVLNKIKVGSLYNIVRHRHYEIQKIYWNETTQVYSAT